MEYSARVLSLEDITHDTKRLLLERPPSYRWEAGQSVEIAVDTPQWREEWRPFSFTSVEEDDYLEFFVKIYRSHEGVTKQIAQLTRKDRLRVSQPFGTISYRGPGYFIAGGTGITPFIAILRRLYKDGRLADNRLLYSARTEKDIIGKSELDHMLGPNVVYNVTHETKSRLPSGFINSTYLKQHAPELSRPFYLCGPDEMVRDMRDVLVALGAQRDMIIVED